MVSLSGLENIVRSGLSKVSRALHLKELSIYGFSLGVGGGVITSCGDCSYVDGTGAVT